MFWVLVTWVIVNKRNSAYSMLLCSAWKILFLQLPSLIGSIVVTISLNNSYLTTFSYQSIMALEDLLSFSQDDIFSWMTGNTGQVQNVFGNVFLKNFGLRSKPVQLGCCLTISCSVFSQFSLVIPCGLSFFYSFVETVRNETFDLHGVLFLP